MAAMPNGIAAKRAAALQKALTERSKMTISSAERHEEKVIEALTWLLVWGMSSSEILCLAVGSKNRRFLASLTKARLAKVVRVMGNTYYMLTVNGKQYLSMFLEPDNPTLALSIVRTPHLWAWEHSRWCQAVTAAKISEAKKAGQTVLWQGDRQLKQRFNHSGEKAPDALVQVDGTRRTYIEIENTQKKRTEIEVMLACLCQLLEKDTAAKAEIHIDEGISKPYDHYLNLWRSSKQWTDWARAADGKSWYQSGVYDCSPARLNALTRIQLVKS